MDLCSFWRFICGRIITKYRTTNISTSGSRLMNEDCMSPPVLAAGAAWAKAEEMNTVSPGPDGRQRECARGAAAQGPRRGEKPDCMRGGEAAAPPDVASGAAPAAAQAACRWA